MLRLAPAGRFLRALGSLGSSLIVACSGPEAPAPSKLAETENLLQQPVAPKSDIPSPFTNPNKEPPPPRSELQLPPDELAATLAKAAAARAVDDLLETSLALRPCANKVPQSVECEGEMAIVLVKMPRHKYEAEYYLQQAIAGDDPTLTPDYYRRLGEALGKKGRYADAATAYQRMIDRSKPATAADYNLLSVALQGVPTRLADAADAMRQAYALDGTRHEWLRDQAILLSQIPERIPEAMALFQELKTKLQDPESIKDTDRRIAELTYELEKQAAKPGSGKKPARPTTPAKPAP